MHQNLKRTKEDLLSELAELRKERSLIEAALDAQIDTLFVFDSTTGKPLKWNSVFSRVSGYSDDEIASMKAPDDFYEPEDLKDANKALAAVSQVGRAQVELSLVTKSGEKIPYEYVASVVRDEAGAPRYVCSIGRDVTQRKRAEEELQRSEERFSKAFRSSPGMMAVTSLTDGHFLDVSDSYVKTVGYSREELVGRTALDLDIWARPEDRPMLIEQVRSKGRLTDAEVLVRKKSGEVLTCLMSAELVHLNDEPCLITLGIDITERKQSTEYLERIFNLSGYMVCVAGLDGYFRKASSAFEEALGYSQEELLARPFFDFVHPDDRDRTVAVMEEELAKGVQVIAFENRYRCKDGEYKWLSWTSRPVVEEGLLFAIAYDVTEHRQAEQERRKLEAQVQHAQKLESLGVLAGGIAHDFNNLLMAMLGHSELVLEDLSPVSPARLGVQRIREAGLRAADLCRQMLAYSGRGAFEIHPLDLSELVREMTELLDSSISKKTALRRHLGSDLPVIEADAAQVQQVVMNLITNASEAIGENEPGVVSVKTDVMECSRRYLAASYLDEKQPEGTYVYFEVTDTGGGMDADTRARLFDPFFTTKFTGRGLGLAAVLGIVRGHRGAIIVDSEVGKGTTIRVLFPAVSESAQDISVRDAGGKSAVWRGEGTVLVVDDEAAVRQVAAQMVERLGFDTLTASDGARALEVFRSHADDITCVLLDLTMPEMDGEETFLELRKLREGVSVVLSSGYEETEVARRFTGLGVSRFIQKPYTVEKLRDVLRRAVE